MLGHGIWTLELLIHVFDPVCGILALDIEGYWLSVFVDIFAVILVMLCAHGYCTLFALGHFCLGLCALDGVELIAG